MVWKGLDAIDVVPKKLEVVVGEAYVGMEGTGEAHILFLLGLFHSTHFIMLLINLSGLSTMGYIGGAYLMRTIPMMESTEAHNCKKKHKTKRVKLMLILLLLLMALKIAFSF